MDFILIYQYELLYSFGAVFAFLSMLSYVRPTFEEKFLKKNASMESSGEFFHGFDRADLSSVMGIEEEDDGYNESILLLSKKHGEFSEN